MTDASLHSKSAELPFEFTGTAREYFGIWIVNLFLSIITLGIYTAWAKVRRLRYFYGNTWLDGHNFEYHARPLQILIGRIIVVGYLILVNVVGEIYPFLALGLLLPYLIAVPWVINKAIAFNARMTSYRNVHFGFEGSYLKALWTFVILPVLTFIPLGAAILLGTVIPSESGQELISETVAGGLFLIGMFVFIVLFPIITRAGLNYIGNNTRFGSATFETDAPLRLIYGNLATTLVFVIVMVVATIALVGVLVYGISGSSVDSETMITDLLANLGLIALILLAGIVFYGPFILSYTFYTAGNRNIALNNTELGDGHLFLSSVSRLRYIWIIVSNLVVTIATFMLMRPWAAIRTWRYIIISTQFLPNGSMDAFIDVQAQDGNVVAAEYLDIDGVDFGL